MLIWVSEWNEEEEVLRVGDAGRAGIPDCRRGAGMLDVLLSAGVGIPEVRRPAADSGRLKTSCESSCETERIDIRDSGRAGVDEET